MQNHLIALGGVQATMSSREIADLVESRHDSVKRTIERLADAGAISRPPMVDGEKSANGVTEKLYMIGKRDSYVIVAQLSPAFTARLVDRWQELESAQAPQLPQTFAQALRLAAEQAEIIEQQTALIEQQKPAVEFLDKYVEAKSTKGVREVSKVLGVKERDFVAWLLDTKIMFRQGGSLVPFAEHQHAGRFDVKTGKANDHAYIQARFTPEGIAWIAAKWNKHTAKAA
jgi:phage antirepressor YoqD-like protein